MAKIEQTTDISTKQLLLFLTVAYIFSILVRLIWVYQFQGVDSFYWNDQLMINTNDGYYFAEIARDILAGQSVNIVAHNGAVPIPTVLLAEILPFSFETIILYMPAFLGSLLVIPLILIGHALKQPLVGFISALIGSIVWSYYNRTMTGYYDSDMLNIVMPMMVLWSLIFTIQEQKNRYLILVVIFLILSQWWYPKNIALNTSMVFMASIYSVIFHRGSFFNYKLLIFAFIGLSLIPVYLKIGLSLSLFLIFHFRSNLDKKLVIPVLVASIALFIYSGALNPILSALNLYLVNRLFADELPQLFYYDVINTVREASAIPFETFANRISGSVISFLLASVGVLMILIRYPILIISIPMIAMGFMAYKAGLRFTVYAVPIYALGSGFLLVWIGEYVKSFMVKEAQTKSKYFVIFIGVALFLYPNIQHIISYKVPTVFNKSEVTVLDQLQKIAKRDDYVFSWWDYGYPIRYYSDVNTLIDGGMHTGELNFPISYALINDQVSAGNIARLDVEYAVKGERGLQNYAKDYGFNDPDDFLISLNDRTFKTPEKTRDVYFYLPLRMMDILSTVALFGNIDLTSGKQKKQSFLYQTSYFEDKGDFLSLGRGIMLDKKKGTIQIGQQNLPLKQFIRVGYKGSKLVREKSVFNYNASLSLIYMNSYNRMLLVDDTWLNSTYIQLFVFENYDKDIFEPVIMNPLSKVYKLKR